MPKYSFSVLPPRREHCFLLTFILLVSSSNSLNLQTSDYPPQIHLKAAVLDAPPFAIIDKKGDVTSYSGFQIDLLEHLKVFAAQDGVALLVELRQSPTEYGDAFNLIANDCNTTENPNLLEDCLQHDMIIGDFYVNPERYMRADLSPSWLQTTMTTVKHIDKEEGRQDFTTLSEAEAAEASVCVPKGTYLAEVVQDKFPGALYLQCDQSAGECIRWLKNGNCVLFADDELLSHYRASNDPSLEVTGEAFNTQYVVWPMKEDMPWQVSKLMKKWMYSAVKNATMDELYFKYFKKELVSQTRPFKLQQTLMNSISQYFTHCQCPIGTAGEHCELKCDPENGAADKRGVCVCKSRRWTGPDCSTEVTEEKNMLSPGVVTVGYVMAGINFALVTLCATWVIMNKHRSHVQMAQPVFLLMILLGCLISTSTIFAIAQQDEGDGPVPACAAIPWLYSVGFSLTFGGMFARIRRIYQVISCALEMKRVTISAKETLLTVAVVLAIDVIILSVWTITEPLEWNRTTTSTDVFGDPLESEGYCTSEHWEIFGGLIACFHFLLMTVACYMCYLARKIPENISNGKYVAIAMFSNLQIIVVAVPVMMMLGAKDAQASFFVRMAAIWINDFVVVSLIMGNLIYKVYKGDRESRDSAPMLHSEIRDYARKLRESERGQSATTFCDQSSFSVNSSRKATIDPWQRPLMAKRPSLSTAHEQSQDERDSRVQSHVSEQEEGTCINQTEISDECELPVDEKDEATPIPVQSNNSGLEISAEGGGSLTQQQDGSGDGDKNGHSGHPPTNQTGMESSEVSRVHSQCIGLSERYERNDNLNLPNIAAGLARPSSRRTSRGDHRPESLAAKPSSQRTSFGDRRPDIAHHHYPLKKSARETQIRNPIEDGEIESLSYYGGCVGSGSESTTPNRQDGQRFQLSMTEPPPDVEEGAA